MKQHSILIVGADKGLGLGLVEAYLQRGWNVFATHLPTAELVSLNALSAAYPD